MSGYFAIGISHSKFWVNVGTLWRSAHLFGAAFVFTVGKRYTKQPSDTEKTWRTTPLYHFQDAADLASHMPYDCPLVGVELTVDAQPIEDFAHPPRAVYLLGAEDHGLTRDELDCCHRIIRLPGVRSMNVAAAGTVVMYARHVCKRANQLSFQKASAAE